MKSKTKQKKGRRKHKFTNENIVKQKMRVKVRNQSNHLLSWYSRVPFCRWHVRAPYRVLSVPRLSYTPCYPPARVLLCVCVIVCLLLFFFYKVSPTVLTK